MHDERSAADLLDFVTSQTSLRLLDLTNPGAGQAPFSAARFFVSMWRAQAALPSTLLDLRLDGSVTEDEIDGVVPLLLGIPTHHPRLRRLHLGTLQLIQPSTRNAFSNALAGVVGQLEALTLTQVERWLKDASEAGRLGALLAPIASLSLLPYSPDADLRHLRTAIAAYTSAEKGDSPHTHTADCGTGSQLG